MSYHGFSLSGRQIHTYTAHGVDRNVILRLSITTEARNTFPECTPPLPTVSWYLTSDGFFSPMMADMQCRKSWRHRAVNSWTQACCCCWSCDQWLSDNKWTARRTYALRITAQLIMLFISLSVHRRNHCHINYLVITNNEFIPKRESSHSLWVTHYKFSHFLNWAEIQQ